MQLEDIRAEMEEELTWRKTELKFLKNRMSNITKEKDKEKYRKSLVVMLYSHFEGFSRTCLLIYVNALNSLELKRNEFNECIIAASMNDIFKKYDDRDRKCKIFKRKLPEEKEIHRFFRRTDLIMQFNNFLEEKLLIPDEVVDTESNLRYHVFQKNLYRLGIEYTVFDQYKKQINDLVNKRNSIAHGAEKMGIEEKYYDNLENTIYNIMDYMVRILIDCLKHKKYSSEI